MVCLLLENVALSADDNEELVYCLKVIIPTTVLPTVLCCTVLPHG